jgi:diguanylate cyclase (GGDEF)-like protein
VIGRKFFARVVAFALALMLGASVAIGLTIWKLRDDAINQAKEGAGNIATVLARQTAYSAQTVDLMLEDVLARIADFPSSTPEEFAITTKRRDLHDYLVGRLAKMPQADVINIVDSAGDVVASSRDFPAPAVNLGDRDHFQHFSAKRDVSVFIGEPVFSRVTGTWTMFFARRIEATDGTFLGVALIGARPSQFMRLYDAIGSIPGASALLLRRDGTVYLRHPDAVERAGEKLPVTSEWFPTLAAGGGYFRSPGVFDTETRWVAVRPLDGYPLVVNVAMSEPGALAVWRERSMVIVLGSLTVAFVFAVLLRLIFVGYRKTLLSEALLTEREANLAEKSNELSLSNLRFNTALTHMRQGLAMFDRDDCVVIHNRSYAEMYGLGSDRMPPGTSLENILRMRVANGMYTVDGPDTYLRQHRNHFDDNAAELEHLRDGRYIVVTHQNMPDGGWITTHEDVTERQRAIAQMSHMAHHDALTNLANRSLFLECIEGFGRRAGMDGRFAVLLLDLDQFKAINDTYGHLAGDALLWAVAARMQQTRRSADVIARLGGDEFAVATMLSDDEDDTVVGELADRLLSIIREPYLIEDRELKIGVSIGIAVFHGGITEPTEIMRFADMALYRAKAEGKNCWRMFESAMEDEVRSRRELAIDLDAALGANALDVYYQPVVDTATHDVRGMEALVRWIHPTRGFISPAVFVAIAEEAGHIQRLGDFVLDRACREATKWPSNVKIAVNVSPIQIAASDFVGNVRRALEASGLAPRRLELEITESVLLADNDRNLKVLHELRDLGAAIVLDDFGTGFSSLSYLNSFPFDKIKIDKSFIDGLGIHPGSAAIVSATTSIARAIEAVTTAEGVETEEQSALLRAAAVTQLQGYLFGKPRPGADWLFIDGKVVLREAPPKKFIAA